jgi:hypothetical protein
MRTKLNHPSSTERDVADKVTMSGMGLSGMPAEWLDAGTWRLPSGKALAEFALQAGFLAPLLLNAGEMGSERRRGFFKDEHALPPRNGQLGKGSSQ